MMLLAGREGNYFDFFKFVFVFETWSDFVGLAGLELLIILPQGKLLLCWDIYLILRLYQ
jgi:hypothetical protein